MEYYSTHINKLIEQLSHLPGIGAKSAQRLGFPYYEHAEGPGGTAYGLHHRSKGKGEVLQRVLHSDDQNCVPSAPIPGGIIRRSWLWKTREIWPLMRRLESMTESNHVLHGAISPMLGIGPDDIRLKELMQRLQQDVKEVIIATNSSLEGETTAMYISKTDQTYRNQSEPYRQRRAGGGDLEYIDEVTLLRALEGGWNCRRE